MPAAMRTASLCLVIVILAIASAGVVLAHGVDGAHAHALAKGGPGTYLWAGAIHMLTGYDHLLFLFGVMFFLTSFKDIVTFITAFTIGHSITLIGATLYGVRANYFLIDAVIAISVIYKGFDNLDGFRRYFGIVPPSLLGMVFGFGLVHGFGLATRLQFIGLPKDGLVARLLAFNVGVEFGQVAALAVMVAVLAIFRRSKSFAAFTVIANTLLVICGALLFLMQMHGYLHEAYPDDFGFSTNRHIIDHFNNDIPQGDTAVSEPETKPQIPDTGKEGTQKP